MIDDAPGQPIGQSGRYDRSNEVPRGPPRDVRREFLGIPWWVVAASTIAGYR
jgi:hypothetical protein